MGDSPTQFLLARNLDTMLQEEVIAKGLAKLESIPKRVLLIRDRKTNVSWGFAFIEYQDVSVSRCPWNSLKFISMHDPLWTSIPSTNPSKSKNQKSNYHSVIPAYLSQSTPMPENTASKSPVAQLSPTGMNTATRQNGLNQRKKVFSHLSSLS